MNTNSLERIFTQHHVWLLPINHDEYILGISDFAQQQLGDIVFVELPAIEDKTEPGNACAVVESVKSASDVICPVSGSVVEVNTELVDSPEIINESPYEQGWIIKIKADVNTVIKGKMILDEYNNYLSSNSD